MAIIQIKAYGKSLWQQYRDAPNDKITESESFKSKMKVTGKIPDDGNTKNVEIVVPLKYLSNFWRTLEMPLINCAVNLVLTWSADYVIIYTDVANEIPTFKITETNLYVPVVTSSTQDNEKLLSQ